MRDRTVRPGVPGRARCARRKCSPPDSRWARRWPSTSNGQSWSSTSGADTPTPRGRGPGERDTIVNLYSVGKAIIAPSARCVSSMPAGSISTRRSPATGPSSRGRTRTQMPVRYLLTHQAALPAIARPLPPGAWTRWDAITEALAAQAPWWEPGAGARVSRQHAGVLIGEVVRRITGQTFGSYLRESLTGPAGIDFFVGFGPELGRALRGRAAGGRPSPESDSAQLSGLASMRVSAYRNPADFSGTGVVNTRAWRAARSAVDQRPRHMRAALRGSIRRWPATAGWTVSACYRRRSSRVRASSRCTATTSCSSARRASGSDSSSRWPSAGSGAEPAGLRTLRGRGLARVRRSRRARRLRLRDESVASRMAAHSTSATSSIWFMLRSERPREQEIRR